MIILNKNHQWVECTFSDHFSFKTGRVVILTSGRFAGQKAVVAKNYEDGTKVDWFVIFRNTDSHTCWLSVSLETQELSREALIKRSSLKEQESSHSSEWLIKTTLSQPDSWWTILT